MRSLGLLLSVLFLLCGNPAAAQDAGEGLLNAVSYRIIPADAPVAVRTLDNVESNLILVEEFERALEARGHPVSEDADIVLTFEVQDVPGSYASNESRYVLEFQGRNATGDDDVARARVNIFDSDRGGLINRGRGGDTSIVTPSQSRLDVTIEDRAERRRLWHGWAVTRAAEAESLSVTRGMVPVLAEHIGQTVRQKTFQLP